MRGTLELTAELDSLGGTVLSHRLASPPFFVSKPYDHGNRLQVQVQQVGPGLFGGDETSVRVEVKSGAHLMLISPSAVRLLPRGGLASTQRQEFVVENGAGLEVWPEPLFPHRESMCRQENRISVEPGASVFWFESLAPGRDASGERYLWRSLDLQTILSAGSRPILWERFQGSGEEWAALARAFPKMQGWTGTFFAYTADSEFPRYLRAELTGRRDMAAFGISEPHPGLLVLKFMGRDGHEVRTLKTALMETVRLWLLTDETPTDSRVGAIS